MLFLKHRDTKFTVDGSAFQKFITLSMKNFCLMLAVRLGLYNFIQSVCSSVQSHYPSSLEL